MNNEKMNQTLEDARVIAEYVAGSVGGTITAGTITAAVDDAPITITIPRVDPVAIAELERLTIEAGQTEREAVEALLAFVGPLARWGQNVKSWRGEDWRNGLITVQGFVAAESPAARLYLADWQEGPAWVVVPFTATVSPHSIANPLVGYQLADIVAGLARALEGLHARLPQKIAKAEERAALAREVVAKIGALKPGGGA